MSEAPRQEATRDEIARMIAPGAWERRERALAPYRENRGSRGDENWLYETTWLKGMRTAAEVDDWLRTGKPLLNEATIEFQMEFQASLSLADGILALLKERGMVLPTNQIEGTVMSSEDNQPPPIRAGARISDTGVRDAIDA